MARVRCITVEEIGKLLMEKSDIELVDLAREGHKEAFSELVVRHQEAVYNLAFRMAGNHADATELAQNAFVRAYNKLALYKREYAFRNWVMSICANQSRNLFRSRDRQRNAENTYLDLLEVNQPLPESTRRAGVDRALLHLPETLRIPVVLKHMEGLSYEEVGAVLNIGVSAAKMRVKRGIEKLSGLLCRGTNEAGYETE
jgi:RNA polymerase sigma-70 factor (ECF subfamily)